MYKELFVLNVGLLLDNSFSVSVNVGLNVGQGVPGPHFESYCAKGCVMCAMHN